MIREFRNKYKLTQQELSYMSGVSRQRISEFEAMEEKKIEKSTPKFKQLYRFMIEFNERQRSLQYYQKTSKLAVVRGVVSFFANAFRRLFR